MENKHIYTYTNRTLITALTVILITSFTLLILREWLDFIEYPNKSRSSDVLMDNFSDKQTNSRYGMENIKLLQSVATLQSAVSCILTPSCGVSCSGGTLQVVVAEINHLLEGNTCEIQKLALALNGTIFPIKTLFSGWLDDISLDIDNLKIEGSNLDDLGESAFSGKPFSSTGNLLSLSLINTNIKVLRKSTFSGSSIRSLNIDFGSTLQSLIIEEDVLGDTSQTVEFISIHRCIKSGEALKNLTGRGSILPKLSTLDLGYNEIPKLKQGTFSKAPLLSQIYLMSSGISEIDGKAFQGLGNLIQIHIQHNNLETLSEETANGMNKLLAIYMDGNPWNCSCELQWIKSFIKGLGHDDFKCRVGSEWKRMDDVDFCPANSSYSSTSSPVQTTLIPSTPSPTTTTPTQIKTNDFIYEKVLCRNHLMYPFQNTLENEKIFYLTSVFKRRNINFTLYELIDSTSYILDLTGEVRPKDFLIWTNARDRTDYGCVFQISGHILMNLQYETTYTICFASNDTIDQYAIIADDCTALTTPPNWEQRAWLTNKQKTAVLVSVCLTFLLTLSLASAAVYYLVKYNPELLKGSKRVLIVKSGSYSPNVLVMPNKRETIRQVSLRTNYEGYLTPKLKRNNKYSDLRYQEWETISDNGTNDVNFDVDEDNTNDKAIYEPPPPLPPNHPTKRRESEIPYFYSNM